MRYQHLETVEANYRDFEADHEDLEDETDYLDMVTEALQKFTLYETVSNLDIWDDSITLPIPSR